MAMEIAIAPSSMKAGTGRMVDQPGMTKEKLVEVLKGMAEADTSTRIREKAEDMLEVVAAEITAEADKLALKGDLTGAEEKYSEAGALAPKSMNVRHRLGLFYYDNGWEQKGLEALDKLGGMLRVGIPDYRLPIDVLDREIDYLLKHGIEVKFFDLWRPFHKTGKRMQRAHKDGMEVSYDSPEAFEEIIWLSYMKDKIVTGDTLSTLSIGDHTPGFVQAFRSTVRKLLLYEDAEQSLPPRYLST